jgi:hypothetical protein
MTVHFPVISPEANDLIFKPVFMSSYLNPMNRHITPVFLAGRLNAVALVAIRLSSDHLDTIVIAKFLGQDMG